MLDAIIVSDLHLGAPACQVDAIEKFMDIVAASSAQRLILNGDVLESTTSRLSKRHLKILSRIRTISERMDVIWIRGNHDHDADSIAHLVGASFVSEYIFRSGPWSVLCVHGDAWDTFISTHPLLTNIADWFYLNLQRISRELAVRTERSSKVFLRSVNRVCVEAKKYAKLKCVDVVCCGHTHQAEKSPLYFNSGCWTNHHCHFLTVEDGVFNLREQEVL